MWFAFLGMIRDAHIQRSFLVKKCDHAWLFHCVKGKDRSKPFDWVIPAQTVSGTAAAHKMMQVVNKSPYRPVAEGDPPPFLLYQWGPNTCDPVGGQTWRTTPMRPTQMSKGRQVCSKLYPLLMIGPAEAIDSCSYAGRRAGPQVLGLLMAKSILRNAFGNWKVSAEIQKEKSDMADRYTENQLQIAFQAKFLVAEAIRRTIREQGNTNFQWGEVAARINEVPDILAEAGRLAVDIKMPERESQLRQMGVEAQIRVDDLLDEEPPWRLQRCGTTTQRARTSWAKPSSLSRSRASGNATSTTTKWA